MKLLLTLLSLAPLAALAAGAPPPAHGKVVLVAFTGAEDAARLAAPYKHALLMKQSGKLQDVAVVVYGRAVSALSTRSKGTPEPVRAAVREAHAAGIPIYVCENSLEMAGIAAGDVVPEAQRVPSGAVQIAQLVSEGFVPLQY